MKKDSLLTVAKIGLAAGGGAMVAKGWITETEIEQVVGAILTIFGAVWSFISRRKGGAA